LKINRVDVGDGKTGWFTEPQVQSGRSFRIHHLKNRHLENEQGSPRSREGQKSQEGEPSFDFQLGNLDSFFGVVLQRPRMEGNGGTGYRALKG